MPAEHLTMMCKPVTRFALIGILLLEIHRVISELSDGETSLKCDLYIAKSTIKDAGLGLFVGSDKKVGDIVGPGDVAIPLIDLPLHRGKRNFFSMFTDYGWKGRVMGMQQESNTDDVEAYMPGLDCVINCNLALINTAKSLPYFDSRLERHKSPGAGAITPYFNGTSYVTADIPAGGELFKFYGDMYFTSRYDVFGDIPLRENFTEAEEVSKSWMALNISSTVKESLWNTVQELPWKSRTVNALPASVEQARQVATEGIRSIYQPQAVRTLQELESEGRCQDNIRHGISTLPDAGRGAFATRSLKKGDKVSGSPLLHIPNRGFVDMHKLKKTLDGKWIRKKNEIVGKQLVMNYCWGHVASRLLLCPYGAGVNFINHNQTKANIKIKWAPHGIMSHNDSWLTLSSTEMYEYKVNLALDYIASTDIEVGDEIFLDYGSAWENALNKHKKRWLEDVPSEWIEYGPAEVWNRNFGNSPIRTSAEQQHEPYPKHLLVRCKKNLSKKNYIDQIKEKHGKQLFNISDKGVPCRILERYHNDRRAGEFLYDVELNLTSSKGKKKAIRREGVPRNSIQFVDSPYSTDIHLQNSFRFSPQIPDEIFPDAWRDNIRGNERYKVNA